MTRSRNCQLVVYGRSCPWSAFVSAPFHWCFIFLFWSMYEKTCTGQMSFHSERSVWFKERSHFEFEPIFLFDCAIVNGITFFMTAQTKKNTFFRRIENELCAHGSKEVFFLLLSLVLRILKSLSAQLEGTNYDRDRIGDNPSSAVQQIRNNSLIKWLRGSLAGRKLGRNVQCCQLVRTLADLTVNK